MLDSKNKVFNIVKVCPRMPAYPNAYAKVKKCIFMFNSKENGSSSVSQEMIFYALQSERIRFKFYSLSSNPKNPEIQPKH